MIHEKPNHQLKQKFEAISKKYQKYLLCEIQFLYKTEVVLFSFGNEYAHVQKLNFFPSALPKERFLGGKAMKRSEISVILEWIEEFMG